VLAPLPSFAQHVVKRVGKEVGTFDAQVEPGPVDGADQLMPNGQLLEPCLQVRADPGGVGL